MTFEEYLKSIEHQLEGHLPGLFESGMRAGWQAADRNAREECAAICAKLEFDGLVQVGGESGDWEQTLTPMDCDAAIRETIK